MKIDQIMERLLAEIRTNEAKGDANLKEMKEEMTARLEEKIDTNQEKMIAKFDAHHERMMARMDSQLGKIEACRGMTDTTIWRPIEKSRTQ
jgi:hypothetical protein